MHRTPAKSLGDEDSRISTSPQEQQESLLNTTKTLSVRRSVGEWEAGKPESKQKPRSTQNAPVSGASTSTSTELPKTPPKKVSSKSRAEEARLCHNKAKMCLSSSRNLKSDLKSDIIAAVERLYQLVKEAEAELTKTKGSGIGGAAQQMPAQPAPRVETNLSRQLEENSQLLKENIIKMEELKSSLALQKAPTYAGAVASTTRQVPNNGTLHSVVVTSQNETETGEEVLEKLRKALDAKEGWVKVERVRKAKDRKIIMGFGTTEERDKARKKIERDSALLRVEEVRNKDPLLVLKDVLTIHSDEEVLRALRNQNREVFHGLKSDENRIAIKYRRKTRNPHTSHIVVMVSPSIWGRALEQRRMRIDLQNVFVEDQSPLVQCSKCLGYGHGRRFCKVPADLCSHCGGPHLSVGCPDKLIGVAPNCVNCKKAGSEKTGHNAFSSECPVRRKWDGIARSSIQYC